MLPLNRSLNPHPLLKLQTYIALSHLLTQRHLFRLPAAAALVTVLALGVANLLRRVWRQDLDGVCRREEGTTGEEGWGKGHR